MHDVGANSHSESITNAVLRLACVVKIGLMVDIDFMKIIYALYKSTT